MNTDWIMYISKNQQMVQTAILGMVFILLFLVVIQLGLLKRRVKGICKSIKKYFDVILTEEEGDDETETRAAAVSETVEIREIVRKDSRDEAAFQQEKIQRKQQEDAKILMEVIQEVF